MLVFQANMSSDILPHLKRWGRMSLCAFFQFLMIYKSKKAVSKQIAVCSCSGEVKNKFTV